MRQNLVLKSICEWKLVLASYALDLKLTWPSLYNWHVIHPVWLFMKEFSVPRCCFSSDRDHVNPRMQTWICSDILVITWSPLWKHYLAFSEEECVGRGRLLLSFVTELYIFNKGRTVLIKAYEKEGMSLHEWRNARHRQLLVFMGLLLLLWFWFSLSSFSF